jgi:hypothetical protein
LLGQYLLVSGGFVGLVLGFELMTLLLLLFVFQLDMLHKTGFETKKPLNVLVP